jgi:hypothetical protein
MDAEIPTFGEGYRAKLEHLTIEVQALRECWGYRIIDQNVNPVFSVKYSSLLTTISFPYVASG